MAHERDHSCETPSLTETNRTFSPLLHEFNNSALFRSQKKGDVHLVHETTILYSTVHVRPDRQSTHFVSEPTRNAGVWALTRELVLDD